MPRQLPSHARRDTPESDRPSLFCVLPVDTKTKLPTHGTAVVGAWVAGCVVAACVVLGAIATCVVVAGALVGALVGPMVVFGAVVGVVLVVGTGGGVQPASRS